MPEINSGLAMSISVENLLTNFSFQAELIRLEGLSRLLNSSIQQIGEILLVIKTIIVKGNVKVLDFVSFTEYLKIEDFKYHRLQSWPSDW